MTIVTIFALVLAALFAGVALYITLVEHPARMVLEDAPLLAQWQPSYQRALPIQAGLAVAGGLAAIIAFYISMDWRWAAGGAILLANWPFTLFVIMPVNKKLKATSPSQADANSRLMLVRWGKLHDIRGVLGSAATCMFAWAVIAPVQ